MRNFLKFTLASIVGFVISGIILLFVFFGMLGGMMTSATQEVVKPISDNSILKINLSKGVDERASDNPFEDFKFTSFKSNKKPGLNDILKELNKAAKDPKIKGIYLELSGLPAGISTVEEIRNAIRAFKDSSNKFVIAYSDFYTQKSYYLASIADKVYLNPQGLVEWKGLRGEVMFYTNALKKIGIEPVIIRHGKFKSAVEPFMLDKMSPANKEQTITYIGSIWNNILSEISEKRGLNVDSLNYYADNMLIRNAQSAVKYNLIDGLKYKDEILDELNKLSGLEKGKDVNFVSLSKYKKTPRLKQDMKFSKNKIAVVYATGEINMGKGSSKEIGSDGLSEAIRKARKDDNVKAIVLRVNSPGGSALASEVIWREVILAKKEKPVVVSMGDVAASGGYYISCPANKIFADKNTITGSIGVFGLLFNATELMDKIGISVDGVQTNKHTNIGSPYYKMSEEEKAVILHGVEDIYHTFISHVAEGRGKTTAEIDSIGQGRVWSGINAKEIGLIDKFGGLTDAIKEAAKLAELKDYRVKEYPEQGDFMQQMIKYFEDEASVMILNDKLGASYKYYKNLNQILHQNGIQARMPYDIEVY